MQQTVLQRIRKHVLAWCIMLATVSVWAVTDPCLPGGSGQVFLLSDAAVTTFASATLSAKTAGQLFTPYLTSYGHYDDGGSSYCGVEITYDGVKQIHLTTEYVNPTTGFVALLLDPTGGSNVDAIQGNSPVTFTDGVANITFRYDDVGVLKINAEQGPTREGDATFIAKPADFQITTITPPPSTSPVPVDETAPIYGQAGVPFSVTVTVKNALGVTTQNYGNETSPAGIEVYSSLLVSPVGGRNGSTNTGTLLQGTAFSVVTPGVFMNNTVAFDEVGIIQLKAHVNGGSYLGQGDVISSTPSNNVGRFTPYQLTAYNVTLGQLVPACTGFTYYGQSMGFAYDQNPRTQITAAAQAGSVTMNYSAEYWKLPAPIIVVINNIGNVNQVGVIEAVPQTFPALGVQTYRLETTGFSLTPVPDVLVPPVNAELSLIYMLLDSDGVPSDQSYYALGETTTGNGIPFVGGENLMRHGRIRMSGASGPVGLPLNLPFVAEYYNGAAFELNTLDTCTLFDGLNFDLTLQNANPAPLAATLTVSNNSTANPAVLYFTAGAGRVVHTTLTPGQTPLAGYVDILMNVYDTASWLTYPWGNGDPNGNPIGRAIFGAAATDGAVIFRQESVPGVLSLP